MNLLTLVGAGVGGYFIYKTWFAKPSKSEPKAKRIGVPAKKGAGRGRYLRLKFRPGTLRLKRAAVMPVRQQSGTRRVAGNLVLTPPSLAGCDCGLAGSDAESAAVQEVFARLANHGVPVTAADVEGGVIVVHTSLPLEADAALPDEIGGYRVAIAE